MKPLIIAGAGPAGLAAAITLRRSGYAVEVFVGQFNPVVGFSEVWEQRRCFCAELARYRAAAAVDAFVDCTVANVEVETVFFGQVPV